MNSVIGEVDIMSTRKGAHYITIIIIIVIVLLLAAILYAGKNYAVFKIREHFSGRVLYSKVVGVGDEFTINYIHSVTKQPVDEIFRIENNRTIAMVEMRYDSFGANLPVGSEQLNEETTRFIPEKGFYRVIYENRRFEIIPLRVGQVVADHKIIFGDGKKVRMLDITRGGAYVEIYVEPLIKKTLKEGNYD